MKQVARLLSEFKSFEASEGTLVGIEHRHTLKKGQMGEKRGPEGFTLAEQFYSLAAPSVAQWGCLYHPSKFAADLAYVRAKSVIDTRRCVSFLRIAR